MSPTPSLLRFTMTDGQWREEALADPLQGGRQLVARVLSEEVNPRCDPLGEENKLIFSGGPLAALGVSSAGRLSVGAKSPLTGGIKEANAGGTLADSLARLGYRALVIEGRPRHSSWSLLVIEEGGPSLLPATPYQGLGNEEMAERLQADFGPYYSIASIGPAAEQQRPTAVVAITDTKGRLSRFAARGGLGAVMGSKGLKAILVRADGHHAPRLNDATAFRAAARDFNHEVATSPRTESLRKYGTASTVGLTNSWQGLPTRNFRQGVFEQAEDIGGEALYDLITSRGGQGDPSEACMPVCAISCSNIVPDSTGRRIVSALEYETLVMLGSNLGIGDLDAIARLNRICNELGIDTIEIGAALGLLMEAGKIPFGDWKRTAQSLREIVDDGTLGSIIAQGCAYTGRTLGLARIPAVKNQSLSAYDPRAIKGTGVTYATSPMGADHTAGLTIFAPIDHHHKDGQVALSRSSQLDRAAYDALGLCIFLMAATGGKPELVSRLLNAAYGCSLEPGYIHRLGGEVIERERAFNHTAGFGPQDDRLPAFFSSEPLGPGRLLFDIPLEELQSIWEATAAGQGAFQG